MWRGRGRGRADADEGEELHAKEREPTCQSEDLLNFDAAVNVNVLGMHRSHTFTGMQCFGCAWLFLSFAVPLVSPDRSLRTTLVQVTEPQTGAYVIDTNGNVRVGWTVESVNGDVASVHTVNIDVDGVEVAAVESPERSGYLVSLSKLSIES